MYVNSEHVGEVYENSEHVGEVYENSEHVGEVYENGEHVGEVYVHVLQRMEAILVTMARRCGCCISL